MIYKKIIEKLYKELKRKYGKPSGQWKLWRKRPKTGKEREEVMIGAILTQNTNWKNVELAMGNLKKAKASSLNSIFRLGPKKLDPLIKPAGFHKTKSQYLFSLAEFIIKKCGGLEGAKRIGQEQMRGDLLRLKGVGPETADSILLYALDKPIFVIDEYTRRLVKNYSLTEGMDYHFLQKLFEGNLKRDYRLYQDFHALIVINAKNLKK